MTSGSLVESESSSTVRTPEPDLAKGVVTKAVVSYVL